MRTLGQMRSEYALNAVLQLSNEEKNHFKPFSAGAPSMILKNGFGQALAFWLSKSKSEHLAMLNILVGWLRDESNMVEGDTTAEVIRDLSQMDQKRYREAQQEAICLLEWVKRYANAFLGDETGGD